MQLRDAESQPFLRKRFTKSGTTEAGHSETESKRDERDKKTAFLQICLAYVPSIIWCVAFFVLVLVGAILLSFFFCGALQPIDRRKDLDHSPPIVYHPLPTLKQDLLPEMRRARKLIRQCEIAKGKGHFTNTERFGEMLTNFYALNDDRSDGNVDISVSAIIYSREFTSRLSEVGVPLRSCYEGKALADIVVMDDSRDTNALVLWEMELDINKRGIKESWLDWTQVDAVEDGRQVIRTRGIGKWRAFERGTRVTRREKMATTTTTTPPQSQPKAKTKANNLQLLLFLDVEHQLPAHDLWISDALSLFEKYPQMKVLGGFSGLIKHGTTYGSVKWDDQKKIDAKEASSFAMKSDYQYNRDKVELNQVQRRMAQLQIQYLEFLEIRRRSGRIGLTFEEEQWKDDITSLLDERDTADLFVSHDSVEFKDGWEAAMVSVNKRLKNGLRAYKDFYGIPEFHGVSKSKLPQLMMIPYETQVKSFKGDNDFYWDWIPFMFVTAVRMGPMFVRSDWWFEQLLPHLQSMNHISAQVLQSESEETKSGFGQSRINPLSIDDEWFDMEVSLHTWALGGWVGLYEANGFVWDRAQFKAELHRNEGIDSEFSYYQDKHLLAKHPSWSVWNVSHLVEKNEAEFDKDIIDQTMRLKDKPLTKRDKARNKMIELWEEEKLKLAQQ